MDPDAGNQEKRVLLRFPADLFEELRSESSASERSFNAQVVYLLKNRDRDGSGKENYLHLDQFEKWYREKIESGIQPKWDTELFHEMRRAVEVEIRRNLKR